MPKSGKEDNQQIPPKYQPLAGSERPPHSKTKRLGTADADETATVQLIVRRRPGGPPLKDLDYFQKVPIRARKLPSRQEFEEAHGATQADLDAVGKFCRSHQLQIVESNRSRRWVVARGTVTQMNSAFAVELHYYESPHGKYRGYSGAVQLPTALAGLVEAVIGLDNRPVPVRPLSADPHNTVGLTPLQVAKLYNFPAGTGHGQTIGIHTPGIFGYLGSDVSTTLSTWGVTPPPPPPTDFPAGSNPVFSIWGSYAEPVMDITIVTAIAPAATIVVYFTPCNAATVTYTAADIITTLTSMIHPTGPDPVPTIVLACYWWSHSDDETGFITSPDYTQIDSLFQDAANLQITVLTGSGDTGAYCDSPTQAQTVYPATDPWVLTCGGTTIGNITHSGFDEYVWNDTSTYMGKTYPVATGGGISANALFPVPPYQTSIQTSNNLPTRNNTGTAGRGIPDVAGNASANSGYTLTFNSKSTTLGGTSIAAPLYAGLVARINQNLGENVGFLNPTIYQLAPAICRDVTGAQGPINNNYTIPLGPDGSIPPSGATVTGYPAGVGWDACTGWGSIDGSALLSALQENFYFVVDKSTFGTDEVNDVIPSGGLFSNAFWLVLEGFTPNWIDGAKPTFAAATTFNPTNITGLSISHDATFIEYELGGPGTAYADVVQRIRFAYDVTFTSVTSFPAIGSDPQTYTLLANISIGGTTLSLEPETIFELVAGADPYFTNLDASNSNSDFWYFSQDLRVFTVNAGQSILGATAFTTDPYASIQGFLYYLNHTPKYTQPYPPGHDPLNELPDQSGYETGETSVEPLNSAGKQNYNFAIARVRLQGAAGTTSPSTRVFFRLWVAVSVDTDFQPSTTYAFTGTSGVDLGLPRSPLASGTGLMDPTGQTVRTVPYFATGSASNDYDLAYPGPDQDNNIQNITIPMGQDSLFTYFGCYLDVYNSHNQPLWPGSHHCVVAQIAYDGAPIPTMTPTGATPSPENWDKLAQRNIQITPSGQPGFPVTHRIPQTFDARPSPLPILQADGKLLNYPDELMIDWGNTPAGSVASIYWPQVSSAEVLQTASRLYATHCLSAFDSHTIQCTVTGEVTYIPIPHEPGQTFAGLFTIDLPTGIRVGNEFTITVRRIVSRQGSPRNIPVAAAAGGRDRKRLLNWRCIAGTFLVKIPVSHEAPLLLPEENLLAILKWRLENMSSVYRWHPVVQRYISYVSARVKGMGGDPSAIAPSQYGVGQPGRVHEGRHPYAEGLEFTGKVSAIIYDRFGDFEGFVLLSEEGHEHWFRGREHEVEEIVNRAWTERIVISVFVEHGNHHVPTSIVLRRAAWPYHR